MDQTSIWSKKKLKVISKTHYLPLLVEQPKTPHLTGCITVSAIRTLFYTNDNCTKLKKKLKINVIFSQLRVAGIQKKKCFLYYSLLIILKKTYLSLYLKRKNTRWPSIKSSHLYLLLQSNPTFQKKSFLKEENS